MGRASRHPEGWVILYADEITKSMKNAIEEVSRRRKIQENYNRKYKIIPRPITKEIREWPFGRKEKATPEFGPIRDVDLLEKERARALKLLDFERAAKIRSLINKIKQVKM